MGNTNVTLSVLAFDFANIVFGFPKPLRSRSPCWVFAVSCVDGLDEVGLNDPRLEGRRQAKA